MQKIQLIGTENTFNPKRKQRLIEFRPLVANASGYSFATTKTGLAIKGLNLLEIARVPNGWLISLPYGLRLVPHSTQKRKGRGKAVNLFFSRSFAFFRVLGSLTANERK